LAECKHLGGKKENGKKDYPLSSRGEWVPDNYLNFPLKVPGGYVIREKGKILGQTLPRTNRRLRLRRFPSPLALLRRKKPINSKGGKGCLFIKK